MLLKYFASQLGKRLQDRNKNEEKEKWLMVSKESISGALHLWRKGNLPLFRKRRFGLFREYAYEVFIALRYLGEFRARNSFG